MQDHLFQHNQEMRDLIPLRKRNNIHSRSKVKRQDWSAHCSKCFELLNMSVVV